MHKQARSWRLWVGLMVLPLGLMVVGCGKSRVTVSGKVSYKGQPLHGGTISFISEKGGGALTGTIKEDGSYAIAKVPPGPAKVTVETTSVKPAAKGSKGETFYKEKAKKGGSMPPGLPPEAKIAGFSQQGDPNKYVPIPQQYNDPQKSGLTLTVKGGKNEFNIDLK